MQGFCVSQGTKSRQWSFSCSSLCFLYCVPCDTSRKHRSRTAFLAPLWKFTAMHSRGSKRTVQSCVSLFHQHPSRQAQKCRHSKCTEGQTQPVSHRGSTPRRPRNARESEDGWKSQRIPLELTQERWPWIFAKGGKPSLVTSTLESLSLDESKALLLRPPLPTDHRTRVQVASTWTDNRGIG